MRDKAATRVGQVATGSGTEVGRRLARLARQEVTRLGLGPDLSVRYLPAEHVVRVARRGPGTTPGAGLDYPAHPAYFAVLVEHLRVLARARRALREH
jgi:hypothetical protein